jgi:hypothetical protein
MTERIFVWMCGAALGALASGCATSSSLIGSESEWAKHAPDPATADMVNASDATSRSHALAESPGLAASPLRDASSPIFAPTSLAPATASSSLASPSALDPLAALRTQGESPSPAPVSDLNRSNNPLTKAIGVSIQDYYSPEVYGIDQTINDALFRGIFPIEAGSIPVAQIVRVTVPISTRPDGDGDYVTGFGDTNVLDFFLVGDPGGVEIGVGPQLTIPTATSDFIGTDKWQAGLGAIAIKPTEDGLLGGLLTWQQSFAGEGGAPDVSTLTLQPLFIHNLNSGWYLRSTGIWTFDLEHGNYYIPVGIGGGAVWRQGSTLFNAFIEPQFTIAHDGPEPQFTIFFGINTTLG